MGQRKPAKTGSRWRGRSDLLRDLLIYGVACGLLLTILQAMEYRLLVVEHSVAVYGGLIALVFAAIGIALGATIRQRRSALRVEDAPVAQPFELDEARRAALGITPRELEILTLIARGLSNRQIAERLFISENTVKTHARRLFEKLGARRRTEAVRIGRASRLIP